jgi:hypothetical protein
LRILSSSNSNFNSYQLSNIKNKEFNKIDNLKSKLIGVPSSGNLFDSSIKKNNENKMMYKNLSRKLTSERISKENISNDSIHIKSQFIKRTSVGNIITNDNVTNSINKSKIVAKIYKGVVSNHNLKN